MKRLALVTGILVLAAPLALAQTPAQTTTWIADSAHSEVDFSIRHLSISNVHGRFGKITGTIVLNEADVTKSTVTATVDVATADTGESNRDNHIKSPDFFDVAKFPTATFTSTSVQKNGSNLTVTGNFTLHGVTKPVVLSVEGPAKPVENGMDHKLHTGFSATTTISRTAFGVGANFGPPILSDEVKLTIELDVAKQ